MAADNLGDMIITFFFTPYPTKFASISRPIARGNVLKFDAFNKVFDVQLSWLVVHIIWSSNYIFKQGCKLGSMKKSELFQRVVFLKI